MSAISEIQLAQFKIKLLDSVILLRADIYDILQNSTHSSHHLVATQLQKLCNDQLLDLLLKIELPLISHKTDKIKNIDAALNNIDIAMFGLCSDCEEPIEIERLNENPTIQRCLSCENGYNKQKQNHYKL